MFDASADWPVRALLHTVTKLLHDERIDAPRRNAEWMLEEATGWNRTQQVLHATDVVPTDAVKHLQEMVTQRLAHVPLQYILGHADFYGLRLHVSPAVLIPRPETEQVVEAALAQVQHQASPCVLDIGTGSGCIALAIKHQRPDANVMACDISNEALAVARYNGATLQLEVNWLQADVLATDFALPFEGTFDLVISNPPYVLRSEAASLAPEVRNHEPALALFTEGQALRYYRAIAQAAKKLLTSNGWLVFETHADHGTDVAEMLQSTGYSDVRLQNDLAGLPRIVSGSWHDKATTSASAENRRAAPPPAQS